MLAYVFWHRPQGEVDPAEYVKAQRSFHAALEPISASFRLAELPFEGGGPGYEDWYLVEGWQGLGELNEVAVDAVRRPSHDRVAAMSGVGWGSVYALAKGEPAIPDGAEWRGKPPTEPYDEFIASLPETAVWQRQMVLGPGPEFCLATTASAARVRIWP